MAEVRTSTIKAQPFDLEFIPKATALIISDMQRDFVWSGGFGPKLGNDTSLLLAAVAPAQRVLEKARENGLFVIHTREGHRQDLTDSPPAKLARGGQTFMGEDSPMGRILVRGEQGYDIIRQLYPVMLSDCVASYYTEFQRVGLEMIKAQGAIFGWVSNADNINVALG